MIVRRAIGGDEREVGRRPERRGVLQRRDDAERAGSRRIQRALIGGVALAEQRHL